MKATTERHRILTSRALFFCPCKIRLNTSLTWSVIQVNYHLPSLSSSVTWFPLLCVKIDCHISYAPYKTILKFTIGTSHAMHLVCLAKFCIIIVFNFSWDNCNDQEKLENWLNTTLKRTHIMGVVQMVN